MVDHPEWASSQDPRHLAELFNERNNSLKPVANSFNAFYGSLPEEVKKRVLVNKRIQTVHHQFAQVVDDFILEHTNSVYLLRHKDVLAQSQPKSKESGQNQSEMSKLVQNQPGTKESLRTTGLKSNQAREDKASSLLEVFDLVVYVDNSLVAAELNARRELIRLKYREQFRVVIDVFEIRISRGSYKDKYPFKNIVEESAPKASIRELTKAEIQHIDELVSDIPEGTLKESFKKAIKAQKQNTVEK